MDGVFVPLDTAEQHSFDWGTFQWVSRPGDTNSSQLVVCLVTIEPGNGHDFHRHPNQEEVIHVLDGEVEQWLGTQCQTLKSGDSVFIAKDQVHASFNSSTTPLRALAILGPSVGEEGYELIDVSQEKPWSGLRSAE